MAFRDLARRLDYATGLSARYREQDALFRFLIGSLYDDAKLSPFDQEYTGISSGQYIRLRDRRPSVVSNFAGQFVGQVVSLLFADEQFPAIRCYDDRDEQDRKSEQVVEKVVEQCALDEVLSRAAWLGSVGSAAIVVRGLTSGRPFFEAWRGYQCLPAFDPLDPERLISLTTIYPVSAEQLAHTGIVVPKGQQGDTFWMRVDLTPVREIRYRPMPTERFQRLGETSKGEVVAWEIESEWDHGWRCVPAIWCKSPNASERDIDGPPIFGPAVDTIIEIDYQLSQIGRAYKYTADPLLAVRRGELNVNSYDPSGSRPSTTQNENGSIIKSVTNTLDIPAGGDAKLLEISGSGLTAALEYVSRLREYALESIGGMKSDAETQKGAQSGKALEMLYQALVLVVKRMRLSWGNRALVPLIELLLHGLRVGEVALPGIEPLSDVPHLRLVWPAWMTPTGSEMLATAQAWQALAGGSPSAPVDILPREIVTRIASTNLGLQDAQSIVEEIEQQRALDERLRTAKDERAEELAAVPPVPGEAADPADASANDSKSRRAAKHVKNVKKG